MPLNTPKWPDMTFFQALLSGGVLTWILGQLKNIAAARRREPVDRLKAEVDEDDAVAGRYKGQLEAFEGLLKEARASAAEARRDASEAWMARRSIETLLIEAQRDNAALRQENVNLKQENAELKAQAQEILLLRAEVRQLRLQTAGCPSCPHAAGITPDKQ